MKRTFLELIVALAVLAVTIAAYGGWYAFVESRATRALTLESEAERMKLATESESETRDILEELREDEAALSSRSVASGDISLFLEELEGTGRSLGSEVDVISVSDTPTREGRIPLTLQVTGSFETVLRTIGALEYGPRDIRIESLTVDTGAEPGGEWTASATFSIGLTATPS